MTDVQSKAKELARQEVLRRVKTLEMAKESFREWIKEALALGGQEQSIIDFWNEVYRQIDFVTLNDKS